jgi:basic membrane protein A
MRGAALVILCLVAAGCGGGSRDAAETTARESARNALAVPPGPVRVAVVGRLGARLSGVERSSIDRAQLVFVGPAARGVAKLAKEHPETHFVLVDRVDGARGPNVAGLLFDTDEAAYLAGAVAALVTRDEGEREPRVAWVGTSGRQRLVDAFERGAKSIVPTVHVIRAWAQADAARCKEAALEAIAKGASVVFAGSGPCVPGALSAAADQNAVGLDLADFERPSVAIGRFVDDARKGLYHGGENIVFGVASGAVGVGRLDPRIDDSTVARAREIEAELAAGRRSAR